MNERESENKNENENDGGHVSPKSSPFLLLLLLLLEEIHRPRGCSSSSFRAGVESAFYARGEKFENFSHIRVCVAGLRAHTYTYTHTHAERKERKRERECERESERLLQREKRFLLNAIYYYILYITTLLNTPEPKHP